MPRPGIPSDGRPGSKRELFTTTEGGQEVRATRVMDKNGEGRTDSWARLAHDIYGDAKYAQKLADYNAKCHPPLTKLEAGATVKLPDFDPLTQEEKEMARRFIAPGDPGAAQQPVPRDPGEQRKELRGAYEESLVRVLNAAPVPDGDAGLRDVRVAALVKSVTGQEPSRSGPTSVTEEDLLKIREKLDEFASSEQLEEWQASIGFEQPEPIV